MKHLDPATDYELRLREESKQVTYHEIEDVLDEPVYIDGLYLDATVSAWVKQTGQDFEIDSVEFAKETYVIADKERVELDYDSVRSTGLYEKFKKKVKEIAIERAKQRA